MSNRRTRDRHLAKLAARRQAERRRKRRQRVLAIAVAFIVAVAGLAVGAKLVFFGKKAKAAAKPTPTHSLSPTPSASPSPTATAVACAGTVPAAASQTKATYAKAPPMTIDTKKTYTVTMETSCGTIKIAFDPKQAPNTVNSMVFLIQHHFYDGLIFHRIAQGFVIQGGDPKGDGTGGPGVLDGRRSRFATPSTRSARWPWRSRGPSRTAPPAASSSSSRPPPRSRHWPQAGPASTPSWDTSPAVWTW